MKLSDILTATDLAYLATAYAEASADQKSDYKAIRKIAEIVAVTTANRLNISLEIDEWGNQEPPP